MRTNTWRSMLLASGAALALTTGLSLAQGTTQDHGGAPGAAQERGGAAQAHSAQLPGNPSKSMSNADRADRAGQGTKEEHKGAQLNERGADRSAQENHQGNGQNAQSKNEKNNEQSAQYRDNRKTERNKNQANRNDEQKQNNAMNREKTRGTAERRSNEQNARAQHQNGNNNAAAQLKSNSRLQANASGVNVKLNDQQRNEIRTTVIDKSGAPRVDHVDFDLTVGTVIPREHVHVVPVPETLVRIEPEWRGYLYFVYETDVVIVNPRDMKIVAVLAV